MELRSLQKVSAEIIDKIDNKFKINRDAQLSLSQLVEELGELAKETNKKKLRGKDSSRQELEDEFADVFLQLIKLADLFDIDLEKATMDKIEVLEKRHRLE